MSFLTAGATEKYYCRFVAIFGILRCIRKNSFWHRSHNFFQTSFHERILTIQIQISLLGSLKLTGLQYEPSQTNYLHLKDIMKTTINCKV